jgi:hypothetical protein
LHHDRGSYQGAVAHKFFEAEVLAFVYFLLEDAQRHWLLDYIVVIGDMSFINAALEQPGRVMAAGNRSISGCV